ncbi:F-box domain-containing protein [Mycena venus]|uniref:F-box domain-containing protein n=1 Tax=Mycena venus TaxID=2733690 RepID=A0A8H6YG50_9AGAR|nr:F-box domain-containing protein [Mycena venus]
MLSALAGDRARVADLEARILDLEHSLAALRLEKWAAQERLDSYKYPVLTLPNELVSEIFIYFLPIYPVCPPLTGILSPICLTHICRKWRDIGLATPALWRAMSLSGNHNTFDWLEMWLGRSGCCPLSIRMDEWEDGDIPLVSELIAVVLLHRARLEHLQIRLFGPLPAIETRLPLLSHLDLEFDNFPNGPIGITFHEDDVPLLRTVTLDVIASRNVVLPWAQLTSLTLRQVDIDSCVPILRKATNLVYCQLDLEYDDEESHQCPDIILPKLQTLCCNDEDYSGPTSTYLYAFVVPALRSLHVAERFLRPDRISSLSSFISKSGCKLQDVRITGRRIVREETYRKAFPLIQNFSFDGAYVGNEGWGD